MTSLQRQRRARPPEFSKLIVAAVMMMYFWGIYFGAGIVRENCEHLPAYLAYIGSPVAVAIGFYAWKARAENVIKLGGSVKDVDDTNQAYY